MYGGTLLNYWVFYRERIYENCIITKKEGKYEMHYYEASKKGKINQNLRVAHFYIKGSFQLE